MKKRSIRIANTKLADLSVDDLFDEVDWKEKAARLQARRWRIIKRQMI